MDLRYIDPADRDATLGKVKAIRETLDRQHLAAELEVDGGIKPENAARVVAAGATVLVAGSAIFGSGDYAHTIADMQNAVTRAAEEVHAEAR